MITKFNTRSPVKSRSAFIGIDPGASGGLAIVGGNQIHYTPMPPDEQDIYRWFRDRFRGPKPNRWICPVAVIEQVHSMPGQGVSSTFKFGQSYGFLRACLVASNIRFTAVPPRVWQKALGVHPRGETETKSQFKGRLKQLAEATFPGHKITLATADALLLARYCQVLNGDSPDLLVWDWKVGKYVDRRTCRGTPQPLPTTRQAVVRGVRVGALFS